MFIVSSKILRIVFMLLCVYSLNGCFALRLFDTGPSVDLGKNEWKIALFDNDSIPYIPQDYETLPTLRFDTQELKLYGNTGCNSFSASYTWTADEKENKKIDIHNASLTRKICSNSIMTFEQKLMEEFDGEFQVIETDKELVLKKEQLIIHLQPYDPDRP